MKEYKEYCGGLTWPQLPNGAGVIREDGSISVKRACGVPGGLYMSKRVTYFNKTSFQNKTSLAYGGRSKSFYMPYEFFE